MERGLDQLIFFAFIVLAALVDWVVRVIRNRNAPPRPPVEEPEVEYFEEEEQDFQEEAPQPRRSPVLPPQEPVAREVVFDAPVPAEWRRVIEVRRVPVPGSETFSLPELQQRLQALPEFHQRLQALPAITAPPHATPRPAARRTSPAREAAAGSHRWRREALGLKAPGAARRAIVMMAVLGPCRALEDQPRGW